MIAARRLGTSPPSIADIVDGLASASSAADDGVSPGAGGRGPAEPQSPTWRVVFVPSAALVERGVKVDTVRARLGAMARIVSVAPKVTAGGIAFEFLVADVTDESAFDGWAH